MRIDHVCYAAGPEGMKATAIRLADQLQVSPRDGGVHPRFGTRNMVLPLAEGRYLEVVEVLDHPASDKAPFGQAVRARSAKGGGWMAWVLAVDDLSDIEERLGREAVPGNRHTPEGIDLTWRQIGIKSLIEDPQLPFFVRWDSLEHHPSTLGNDAAKLVGLHIAGDPVKIKEWLGKPAVDVLWEGDIEVDFDHSATHALDAVTFDTVGGTVTI
ncbi:MAG: VOC family protein [Ornithinimicrobium sp.]